MTLESTHHVGVCWIQNMQHGFLAKHAGSKKHRGCVFSCRNVWRPYCCSTLQINSLQYQLQTWATEEHCSSLLLPSCSSLLDIQIDSLDRQQVCSEEKEKKGWPLLRGGAQGFPVGNFSNCSQNQSSYSDFIYLLSLGTGIKYTFFFFCRGGWQLKIFYVLIKRIPKLIPKLVFRDKYSIIQPNIWRPEFYDHLALSGIVVVETFRGCNRPFFSLFCEVLDSSKPHTLLHMGPFTP